MEVDSLNDENAALARSFGTRIGEVAAEAKPDLAAPLNTIRMVFEDFAQAWDDSGSWTLDAQEYKAAKDQVVEICTKELGAAKMGQAETSPTAALTAEEAYLKALRAAHPTMKATDTDGMVSVAKNFCLIYDKGAANGTESLAAKTVQQLISGAAGIEYTLEELQSMHKLGVNAFCPQHVGKIG